MTHHAHPDAELSARQAIELLAEHGFDGLAQALTAITEEHCGFEVSSTQVSRAAQLLDEELEQWRGRPLGRTPYLILNARYEKVRHGGAVVDCAVLVAVGIPTDQGKPLTRLTIAIHGRIFAKNRRAATVRERFSPDFQTAS